MPIIKSAKKRVKIAAKARVRNVRTKRSMRAAMKAFAAAIESGKTAEIQKAQREAMSAIDVAVKKAIIHRNNAARQKAKMAARAKAAGVKSVKPAKATPAKKPSAKKKPVAKTTKKTPKK